MEWIIAGVVAFLLGVVAALKKWKIGPWLEPDPLPTPPVEPIPAPQPIPTPEIIPIPYLWDTPEKARKTVEIMCQERGYTAYEISLLCAVIEAESGFKNSATNHNRNNTGEITSTDWGICQINDRYHIGKGLDFPTHEYVVANPEKAVEWMMDRFEEGHITWWSAYQNGSYKKYFG